MRLVRLLLLLLLLLVVVVVVVVQLVPVVREGKECKAHLSDRVCLPQLQAPV